MAGKGTHISISPDGFASQIEHASFHLLSIVLADEKLRQVYKKYDLPHIEQWFEELKTAETIRLLIEIATMYRLEEWNTRKEDRSPHFRPEHVGTLVRDGAPNQVEDLSTLEACNKIVHAREILFPAETDGPESRLALGEVIVTRGQKGKENWEAHIDLVLFCNAVNQLVSGPF